MGLRRVSIDSQRFVKLLERLVNLSNRGQDEAHIMMGFEVIGTYAQRGLVIRHRLTVFALGDKGVAQVISGLCIVRADLYSFLVVRDRRFHFSFLQKSLS